MGVAERGAVDGPGGAVHHHPAGKAAGLHGRCLGAVAVATAHAVGGPPLQRADGLVAGGGVDVFDLGGDLLGRVGEQHGLGLRKVERDVSSAVADLHPSFEEGGLDLLGVPDALGGESCGLGHGDGFADVHG